MVLITGGAGFIGSHVAEAFLAAGHGVAVVDNLCAGRRENVPAGARFHAVDIRSPELAEVFAREKPEYVCHLAAQMNVSHSIQAPLYDADVNILGSINVLENCVRHEVRKVIFASSAGAVYGEPESLPVSEDHPSRAACHYGVSKYAVEHYLGLYARLYGLNYTTLRFANVYGPRQNPSGEAGLGAILMGMMLSGKRPTLYGFGDPVREYVYVTDVAQAVLLALDKGDHETFNIGSGQGITVREVFEAIRDLVGFAHEPILEPLRPGEVKRIYTSPEKAARLLGWRAETGFAEGVIKTLEFVKSAKR